MLKSSIESHQTASLSHSERFDSPNVANPVVLPSKVQQKQQVEQEEEERQTKDDEDAYRAIPYARGYDFVFVSLNRFERKKMITLALDALATLKQQVVLLSNDQDPIEQPEHIPVGDSDSDRGISQIRPEECSAGHIEGVSLSYAPVVVMDGQEVAGNTVGLISSYSCRG